MSSFADQMGATPPGSPDSQTAFRANKASIMQFFRQQIAAAQPNPILTPRYTQAPPVVPTAPRVGGIEMVGTYHQAWTGGKLVYTATGMQTNVQLAPATSHAYRSTDLSQVLKIEKVCTTGVPETRRLPVPGPMNA